MGFIGDNRKLTNGAPSKRVAVWMWVLLFTLVGPALQLLNAQAGTGLTGTVTDSSGASIANAQISFLDVATGITTRTSSSSVGTYTATLMPGTYNVTVAQAGFEKYQATHVLVEVGATPTLNIKLVVGAGSETVQVSSADTIELDTTNPQLDSMIPPAEVTDLPLEINGNMRQINSFATLAPGVRTGPYGSVTIEGGAPGQINSAGSYYNGLQLDTASAVNSNPPYEMVDEFRVLRSTFSARYGMVQGAISYNMRSGTNKLHGDGFMIDRNSSLDSAGFFPTRFHPGTTIAAAPIDKETDWGGTIGGPVVLPHLYNGHNKTFFLGSYDKFDKNQGITAAASVPTVAERNGDFSRFFDANGKLIPIYDAATGQQFQCNGQLNVICPSRFDPLSKSLLQYIPTPNTTGTNYGLQGNMNPVISSVPFQTRAWGVTVDHQLSPTQSLAFTWWRNHYYVVQEENGSGAAPVPASNPLTGEQSGIDNANIWLANYTKTIGLNMVLTAGFAAQNKMQNYVSDNTNVNFAGVQGSTTMPYISFDGQNAITAFGNSNSSMKQNYVDNIGWNLFNNWMWTKGRHTLNIGGEFHHFAVNSISDYSSGRFYFSQAQTSVPNTNDANFAKYGSSFASFLLGSVAQANRSARTQYGFSTRAFSGYIQDDIKLNSKLTLNAGLRWDLMVPFTMSQNNSVFLDSVAPNSATLNPATSSQLPGAATELGNCATCAGVDRAAIHWKNFGPHVGFAYSLDKNTVVQAGYYINYLGFDSAYGQGEGEGAPGTMSGLLGGSFTVNGTGSYVPGYGQWTNPATGAANPMPAVSPTPYSPSLGVGQTISYFDLSQNGRAPHMQAWNASVQRQVGWNTMVTVAYSATRVDHLTGYNINPISQPNASVLQYGALLTKSINDPAVVAAGFKTPYPNFATQFGGGATLYQALKPFPQYSNVSRVLDQSATTYYSALQIQADKHMSNNLNFLASITLPQLYDNMATSVDKNNQKPSWGEDSMGSFESKIAATYALPFGRGQHWLNSGRAAYFTGGWQVSSILTYNNAQPLQITQSGEGLMNGANRPNFNPYTPLWSGHYNQVKKFFEGQGAAVPLFSTGAWTNTGSQYLLGNANRAYNSVRGPWYPAENVSARKTFHVTEGSYFTVRVDYFNVFNRTQVPFPNTNINASNFGVINSKFAGGNRQGQIEGTFNF
ncbi:MAG TPA: TonB-dependent receptor [Terracidiphilus sp.]|nr:TonB-dependent receptor [Terracidiphilus sp.]